MKRLTLLIVLTAMSLIVFGQKRRVSTPKATSAEQRYEGYQNRLRSQSSSLVQNVKFRNVGPTAMSGRIVDFEVDPNDPTHFYAAFASGGLWETRNQGASFEPLFDNEIVMSIGDIAVDWSNGIIYVGSGENNSSRSSYSGYGVFKSSDNGKTWSHIGLEESHHIGRIVLHPDQTNVIWVAALGHLYSDNEERGIYKTTDGGKTWNKTLYANSKAGGIDLIKNPTNPGVLYAALWQKERKAWNFSGAGMGSGIYKSDDAGDTWTKISGGSSNFPDTNGTGRIGLTVSPSNPNILYAVHDNQDRKEKEEKEEDGLTKDQLRGMGANDFLSLADSTLNTFLRQQRFPMKYTAKSIKSDVKNGKLQPIALVEYLEDANALLFDTPVIGSEVYRSEDAGKTWNKTHDGYLEDLFYSYGYYFAQIRVDAKNPEIIYTMGVPIIKSLDGGKTWKNINRSNVHVDHHALWVNPERSGHLINGNDGGINISFDDGEHWTKCNTLSVGQFYDVNVDLATPYNIYGGLQDNGVWYGPINYDTARTWVNEAKYSWQELLGGDGMQVEVDTRDNNIIYTGFQFGNYYRINKLTGETKRITPVHELGERPLRWNWETPVHLSRHNQDVLYMGSNKFHRSMDQGETFKTLSGDLTNGGKKGNVSYGTLTTITESPLRFGLIYAGTDDGLLHVSRDAGHSWDKIVDGLPEKMWVSSITPSSHVEGRVYASLNGYRWDNFEALVYMSNDYGRTWKKIGSELPLEPVNVVVEDTENSNIVYIGTDHGAYVSLDQGTTFMSFAGGLPKVPVHDMVIQPNEKDLIVGTHGRSVYVADLTEIQLLRDSILSKDLHLFVIDPVEHSDRWGNYGFSRWFGANEPGRTIAFYSSVAGDAEITIAAGGTEHLKDKLRVSKGLNYYEYDMSTSVESGDGLKEADNGKTYILPGSYEVVIKRGNSSIQGMLTVNKPKKR